MRVLLSSILAAALFPVSPLPAQQPADTAWTCREVMVPVRDGVRLQTTIVAPGAAPQPLPILLQRTPYGVPSCPVRGPWPRGYRELVADGYIFVFQNIRGRGRSEGEFVMNRPLRVVPGAAGLR